MVWPTTGQLDNFDRANENPLGNGTWSWPVYSGDSQLQVLDNVAGGTGATSFQESYWSSTTFGPDSEVYVTFSILTLLSDLAYLDLRIANPNSAGLDCYEWVWDATAATGRLYRVDDTVNTLLGATFSITLAAGNRVGLEMIGSNLAFYDDNGGSWTQRATRSDSTYTAAGFISMGLQGAVGRYDNFSGGTVVAGAPTIRVDYAEFPKEKMRELA